MCRFRVGSGGKIENRQGCVGHRGTKNCANMHTLHRRDGCTVAHYIGLNQRKWGKRGSTGERGRKNRLGRGERGTGEGKKYGKSRE